jgi:hypothetical protein
VPVQAMAEGVLRAEHLVLAALPVACDCGSRAHEGDDHCNCRCSEPTLEVFPHRLLLSRLLYAL